MLYQRVRRLALDHWLGGGLGDGLGSGAMAAEILAQQYDRADGGGLQVSLGPRRSPRSSEASCTIHCTSSSKLGPQTLASSGTSDVSVMPGFRVWARRQMPPVPSMRKSATAHAPAAKRHMRRQR